MGRRNAWVGWLCAATMMVGMATTAWSDEGSPSYVDGMLRKLGRGIANIATGPAELIRTPELVGHKSGTLAGLTVGVLQGAWRTVLRVAVGAFEVLTFYAEVPDNFDPLVKPEFVWAHGDWSE